MKKSDLICAVFGALASAGVKLFGGWNPTIRAVLILMALDLITGFIVAAVFHKSPKTETGAAESWTMFKGICRKFGMLIIMAVAHQLDIVIGVSYIMTAVTYGFIANEALSITENAGLMGIIKSDAIINAIDVLKKRSGGAKDENG